MERGVRDMAIDVVKLYEEAVEGKQGNGRDGRGDKAREDH